MKIRDLITTLESIAEQQGNIDIRCGEHRIGGIKLVRFEKNKDPVAVITPRGGVPVSSKPIKN